MLYSVRSIYIFYTSEFRLGEPAVKKTASLCKWNPHKLDMSSTRLSDLLKSPYVIDSDWILFLAYLNLFGNKKEDTSKFINWTESTIVLSPIEQFNPFYKDSDI